MDPYKTLDNVAADITAGNYHAAAAGLREYWQWRQRGGFEPVIADTTGDTHARYLEQQLPARYLRVS